MHVHVCPLLGTDGSVSIIFSVLGFLCGLEIKVLRLVLLDLDATMGEAIGVFLDKGKKPTREGPLRGVA